MARSGRRAIFFLFTGGMTECSMGETSESTSEVSHHTCEELNQQTSLTLKSVGLWSMTDGNLLEMTYGLARRLTYQYIVQSVGTSKSLVVLDEQLTKTTGPHFGREGHIYRR